MPAAGAAVLRDREGRVVLRFERSLPHAPERVWQALISVDELTAWHPTPFELEPSPGGTVRFRADLGGPEMPQGKVLAYDPPRTLAYTWGEDELRFTLTATGERCLLVLEHTFEDRMKAARDAAGWELCLRALERALAGEAGRLADDGGGPWAELNRDYEERFGIAPEDATPPPPREEIERWRSRPAT
ncbi:MAG TPA: SRPBCC family protein [Solirubrobacteraceae bacterium]|jgi:uncharacterized protein YndB with AHSA1/START domain|nr:SRPBCC family protein [Solirubrobacteraceae bacterium]